MKLSKTSWLLITIGIFVIALAGLSVVRSQQVQQQNQLSEELTSAELSLKGIQLEQLSYQREELEKGLSLTTSQFEVARAMLSQPIESIAISSVLFDIAEAHGVELTEINSSGLASDELEGLTSSVLPLTAKIEGDVPNLVSFITGLNGDLTTGVVKSVNISIPEMAGEEASANIQLVVYTYQGE